ncbi:hypothetical protein RIF29_20549 [Crotalaria pallida]|uniref:SKP1-like protein n=1 Tax=Crotalaria pallida TaxID=3830 RepID=A0AAN9F1D9_CROPI
MAKEAKRTMISLKSSDGDTFEVSPLIVKQMLTVQAFVEDDDSSITVIPLPNVNTSELTKTIEYLNFHHREEKPTDDEAKKFDAQFLKNLNHRQLLELVIAANYLNAKEFLDFLNQGVADRIKNKSVKFVRKMFGIESDFTPAEEDEILKEHAWAHEGVDPDREDL